MAPLPALLSPRQWGFQHTHLERMETRWGEQDRDILRNGRIWEAIGAEHGCNLGIQEAKAGGLWAEEQTGLHGYIGNQRDH